MQCLIRAVGTFFMVGGWVKITATMVGRRRKIKKKHWLKRPKAIPQKTKFGPKYKWFKISYLSFFFWKYVLEHTSSLDIENNKITCSRNPVKNLSHFTNFPANKFLFCVRKNIFTVSFPNAQELHSRSTLKANVCIFIISPYENFCFKDAVTFVWWDEGWGEAK